MKLVFLHTSDIHGFLLPTDYQTKTNYNADFGLSRVKAVIDHERSKYGRKNVIVTDAGDSLQGSALAAYVHNSGKEALAEFTHAYNLIDYDVRVLGNHDFDFGLAYLRAYLKSMSGTLLNANILDEQTGLPAFGQAFKIIKRNGIKIGFLGITTQFVPNWENPKKIHGLKFISAYTAIKERIKKLRSQVDILAVVYHGGFESSPLTDKTLQPHNGENEGYRILQQFPEIDVLLTGHQHSRINLVSHNTAIIQPGYRGEAVGEVLLELDDTNKKITQITTKLIDTKNFAPAEDVTAAAKSLNNETQLWLDQPLARLPIAVQVTDPMQARLKGSPFINLLQQMQLQFTKADISVTALMSDNAKGFKQIVTMRDLLLNYPFANQLCRVKVTGKQLRHIIEYSLSFLTKDQNGQVIFTDKYVKPQSLLFNFDLFYPVKYRADISRSSGNRLTLLTLHGKEIADNKIYHLAVNNYRAMGGGFYPEYSKDKVEFTLDRDYIQMFEEYLTKTKIKIDMRQNYQFY